MTDVEEHWLAEKTDERKLDRWLAVHLFDMEHTQWGGTWYRFTRDVPFGACPSFSTTGDGMLMVLEAMRERGWIIWVSNDTAKDAWRGGARKTRGAGYLPYLVESFEGTAPLAVSQAAKAALLSRG